MRRLIEVDNGAIKALLQSFRSGLQDAADPIFAEALARLAEDPVLAEWFRAEKEFDSVMVQTFREVPARLEVKAAILRDAQQTDAKQESDA